MAEPLNKTLYYRLKRIFGHVRISNPSVPATIRRRTPVRGSKTRGNQPLCEVDHGGEEYLVCCPHCSDTRFRCSVNHLFGTKLDDGRQVTRLVVCYNEDCFSDPENREQLLWELNQGERTLERAKLRQPTQDEQQESDEAKPVQPPGTIIPLHHLDAHHPANRYLAGRFFDPEVLSKTYGVGYCMESARFSMARRRIYVPCHLRGELYGYQMRYVGEMDWKRKDEEVPPKWWSCPSMRRSKILYNLEQAAHYKTGVVVEGPADVWGVGPQGVCTYGDSMSNDQAQLMAAHFRRRPVVQLYDPESMASDARNAKGRRIRRSRELMEERLSHKVVPVVLPFGFDPGSLDRRFLRRYIAREAREQGVRISWERR